MNNLFEIIRYSLTLLFGITLSMLFLDIKINKKNCLIILGFFILDLGLQGLFYFSKTLSSVIYLYPLITHLPLFLLITLIFKKRIFPSLISITSAYLCCQISNWVTIFISSFINNIADIVYSISIIISFMIIAKYIVPSICQLLKKETYELISFGIIPIFYYIFDYLSTVYTQLLYVGNKITVEFTPFLLCICYFIFCSVYFKQYEQKQEIETNNKLMYIKQTQFEKEIELMEDNEKKIVLLRHDMRHFLNNILNDLENNHIDHAVDYIHSLSDYMDQTVRKKYCLNDTVNMMISYYQDKIDKENIQFIYHIDIPPQLSISDLDLTSILSNGLENAFKAVMKLDKNRLIEVNIQEKCDKLLISIENTYLDEPVFKEGIPVSKEKNHGFGSQSIVYTVEKLNGNCQFMVKNHHFILRIVI